MAGLPAMPDQAVDGTSLAPAVMGEPLDTKTDILALPQYSNHGMQSPGGAIRFGDYKLLEYYENNTVQLFNLREDLGEQNDLSQAEPDKADELKSAVACLEDRSIGPDASAQCRIRYRSIPKPNK